MTRNEKSSRRTFLEGITTAGAAGAAGTLVAAGTSSASPLGCSGDDPYSGPDIGNGDWLEKWVSYTTPGGKTKMRRYFAYIPPAYDDGDDVPQVTMLHGCGQDPEGFAIGTNVNELADEENFIPIYPDQTRDENTDECWNWFEDSNQHRGNEEAKLIARMTVDAIATWDIDPTRVYVCGMSAGAAQAVNQAVTYPDIYAALASHSGLEYNAANDPVQAVEAMATGGPDPDEAGKDAYDEMRANGVERVVPTYVVHGERDTVVQPINGEQTTRQWAQTNDLAADGDENDDVDATDDHRTTGTSDCGFHYTIRTYESDSGGEPLVKYFTSEELGHAWSGGDADGPDTQPRGENVTPRIWNFFQNHSL